MTSAIDDPETLRRILTNSEALLLDFDGPICSVFAGFPASVVADQLREVLVEGGHIHLPDDVRSAADPFDVLFYAAKLGLEEAYYVESAFRAYEVEAVQSAYPTSNSVELMSEWNAAGRVLAIVSNNSVAVVEAYLDCHDLRNYVALVSARVSAEVSLLKRSAHLVAQAMKSLSVAADRCVLVGDSITDIQASRSVQVAAIGYANKPDKAKRLDAAGADVIITSLDFMLAVLRAS